MENKGSSKRKIWLSIWCLILVGVICFNVWATKYALSWDIILTSYFGSISSGKEEAPKVVHEESEKFTNLEDLNAAEKALELEIAAEGIVLLKNDNGALPLAKGSKVSVLGQSAQIWMTKEKLTNTKDTIFLESLQSAGLEVNGSLRKMYKQSKHTKWGTGANLGNGGIAGTWEVDEVPQSEYKDSVKESYAEYNDAAIVVITRGGSEGGDLPRDMERFGGEAGKGYLELTQNEKDLLASVHEAGFKKTIVILHTTNAMQMEDLLREEYGVDAILWVTGDGEDGVQVIGSLLTGEINPSGKNVDTYVYDNLSAPAMQNFGDFRFTQNGELIPATTTTVSGTYSYQVYSEGIYVGYRYYETRYEDKVTGRANVGEYDYSNVVAYPFGYGLSYTAFDWTDFKASAPDADRNVTLSVKVTNSGAVAGKDVVQLYYQAPYTDYDVQNGIEKSAVNLLEFGKTKLLAPGESETIELTVNMKDMASWDGNNHQCYLLEAGDYYLTLAHDAHDAVNNILAVRGYSTANGMTADGDAARVFAQKVSSEVVLDKAITGAQLKNIFDDCWLEDAASLTRSNWVMMDNDGLRYATGTMTGKSETTDAAGSVYTHEASAETVKALTSEGWDVAGNPLGMNDASFNAQKFSQDSGLTLADMTGKAWDDPDWEKLLDQMSQDDLITLVGQGHYQTSAIASIGKTVSHSTDGPQGMIDYVTDGKGYQFTDANMLGATWNKEHAYRFGDLCSQEIILKGASTWYAPALNLHRTAYSGRNFEYFSEDNIHSGMMGREVAVAARNNGANCHIKHFFMNDQEVNRGANGRLAVFATEQTMRELYAKPFQMCAEAAPSSGIMVSMARVGTHIAPGSYALCTQLIRDEWGMTGAIITDAQALTLYEAEQQLASGCDLVLTAMKTVYPQAVLDSPGGQTRMRLAAKHILFMEANSSAMDIEFKTGFPIYYLILIAYHVLTLVYMAWATLEIVRKLWPEKQIVSKKALRRIRIVLGTIGIVILVFLLFMFFTEWLPKLQFALQTSV